MIPSSCDRRSAREHGARSVQARVYRHRQALINAERPEYLLRHMYTGIAQCGLTNGEAEQPEYLLRHMYTGTAQLAPMPSGRSTY